MSNRYLDNGLSILFFILLGWCGCLGIYYITWRYVDFADATRAVDYLEIVLLIASVICCYLIYKTLSTITLRNKRIVVVSVITLSLVAVFVAQQYNLAAQHYRMFIPLLPVLTWLIIWGLFYEQRVIAEKQLALNVGVGVVIILSLITIISPLQLHLREVAALETFSNLQLNFSARFAGICIIGVLATYIARIAPYNIILFWSSILVVSIAFYLFVNMFVIPSVSFNDGTGNIKLIAHDLVLFKIFLDYLFFISIFACCYFLVTKLLNHFQYILVFCLIVSYVGLLPELTNAFSSKQSSPEILSAPDKIKLTSSGKNIFVFLLDEYQGTYFNRLLESGDIKDEMFEGFYYYPNSLAIAYTTLQGVPAILGGAKYSPQSLFKNNSEINFYDQVTSATNDMVGVISNAGYRVNLVAPAYFRCGKLNDRSEPHINCYQNLMHFVSDEDIFHERSKHKQANSYDSLERDIAISLLRVGPKSLKKYISFKLPSLRKENVIGNKLPKWLAIKNIANIYDVDTNQDSFTFIYSDSTHNPFALNRACNIDVDGAKRIHTLNCVTQSLVHFFEWLKLNKIYHNSKILIISDHGAKKSSDPNGESLKTNGQVTAKFISSRNALTLYKPFDSKQSLQIDNSLISAIDYPILICPRGDSCENVDLEMITEQRGVAQTFDFEETKHSAHKKDYRYKIIRKYIVHDTIFDPGNWTISDEQ